MKTLKEIRKEKGLTQQKLADAAKVKLSVIKRIENNNMKRVYAIEVGLIGYYLGTYKIKEFNLS